ncbi:MAG TPA: GTP-binding protein, partial [Casimicrobiaceae bacterium]|nr:GTP-binding protein [Casimicrobiaceae bacterium]
MSAIETLEVIDHGVLRFLTAGSVDDGKSTLIGRLLYDTRSILADQLAAIERTSARRGGPLDLSLLTDGLTAEREQGITIDVAYRYFATAHRKFIVADSPGHVQYTRNMVTAASTAQLAILLVDARHGIVEQTRRHAALAHLVGVSHLVVAVNKMDLVDWREDAFAKIVADFAAFAENHGIGGVRYIPLSALEGDMIVDRGSHLAWYDGPTLLQVLESAETPQQQASSTLRLPVQYVARPDGATPRAYLGRIEAGTLAAGDLVTVLPSGRTTRVRALRVGGVLQDRAGVHAAVAVELDDELDISRGDLIVHAAGGPSAARTLDADIAWLGSAPLDARRTYALRHTTRDVRARIARVAD